jgi:hypothetical protein
VFYVFSLTVLAGQVTAEEKERRQAVRELQQAAEAMAVAQRAERDSAIADVRFEFAPLESMPCD